QKAAASGVPMVIASGREPGTLARVLRGEPVGTYFPPRGDRLAARKRWIAFAVPPQGRLLVDAGARQALIERGKSLLPSGVVDVEGTSTPGRWWPCALPTATARNSRAGSSTSTRRSSGRS